jgi:hypothetical protein
MEVVQLVVVAAILMEVEDQMMKGAVFTPMDTEVKGYLARRSRLVSTSTEQFG